MSFLRRNLPTGVLVLAIVPFVYPFLFLFATAVREEADYSRSPIGIPRAFTLDHLRGSWESAHLGQAIVNSIVVASVSVAVLLIISLMGAFWFLRHTGRMASLLFGLLVSLWLVPWVVWILPLYIAMSRSGITNNLVVLGVVLAGVNAPFGLYFMTAYLRGGVPRDVLESARVDGASLVQEFRLVVVPLARPAVATVAALGFVWAWGDLFVSVILIQDPEKYTQTIAAAGLVGIYQANVQEIAAAAAIAMIPLLVVFVAAQKAIVRGFTAGAGK